MQVSEKKLLLPSTQCSKNIMKYLIKRYITIEKQNESIGFSEFMQKLNYPLKINRSVLTSVNQHNWPILCGAFAWLCEEIQFIDMMKEEINEQFENKTEKKFFKFYIQESFGKIKMREIIYELAQEHIKERKLVKNKNVSLEAQLKKIKKQRQEINFLNRRRCSILIKREEMKSKIHTLRRLEKNFPQTFQQLTYKKKNVEIQKKKLLNEKTKLQTRLEIIKKKIESQIIKKWQASNLIDSIKQNNTLIEQLSSKKNIQEKKNNRMVRRIEDTIQIWMNKFGLIKVQNLSLMFKSINRFNVKNSFHVYDQWLSKCSNNLPFPSLSDFEVNIYFNYN